jgi:Endosomal/lysosomal potassium channel TMEM175
MEPQHGSDADTRGLGTERIATFSDGVIAIIITIMVLVAYHFRSVGISIKGKRTDGLVLREKANTSTVRRPRGTKRMG